MTILQTIAVAFAMFSALPVPQFGWNEKNMRYAMCAFPLIGLVCGGLWCLCGVLPLPDMARAAAFCLVPVAVTGGIHLDGYADTSDALSSYGDREKKLEILKDNKEAFITIQEGKFHQVKRMFAAVGKEVQYLKRISMGPIVLDDSLHVGECRRLTEKEINLLKNV